MNLSTIWDLAQNKIKQTIGETSYDTWFTSINVCEIDSDHLKIETPDEFFKNWIEEHYQKVIFDVVHSEANRDITITYTVNNNLFKENPESSISTSPPIQTIQKLSHPDNVTQNLNANFTFDNFVIGPSNRFACAAGLAVAENPAKAYNPLFVYGQVGLGKTHLLQAITHKIKEIHPTLQHCYLSSERFTNELIDAIRHRSTNKFRKKYREIDILLIDDIQFIAGKESTQEEFFHTFNFLHDNRKQIIISSDRPPHEISNLEERLSSRFAWGLITDIQTPDFETRVAILRKKKENEKVNVPEEIILFIAQQIKSNIRELEGALIRVAAYALLEDKPLTLDMAKIVLKDMVRETAKIITIEQIQKTVSEMFNVTVADIKAKKRNKNIVIPRQIAMYLSRQLTNHSLPEIGQAFGGKDHTTVMHSCNKIESLKSEDHNTSQNIKKLITDLNT